jgi:chemotaxis protein MotB
MANRGSNVIIITKRAKAAEHHGGAWKVAYADFVTAMMALFIVLWLLSQTDQSTRQKLSEYFRTGMFSGAPALVMGGSGVESNAFLDAQGGVMQMEQQTLQASANAVKKTLKVAASRDAELSALVKDIDISVTEEGLLIQILDNGQDLLFDLSSAELKPRLKKLLETIAPVLEKLKNPIQIHGHTDARPFPAAAGRTNWELSFERANNARRTMEARLAPGQLAGVFAHGSSSPYVKDSPLDPRNRRLAILAMRRSPESAAARGGQTTMKSIQTTRTKVASHPLAGPAPL